jgi:hypothetical protein
MNNLSNKNIPYQKSKIITNPKAINDITRIVNNLKNITFDPLTFDIINLPTGLYVRGKAGGTSEVTDDLATFACTLTGNTVVVRAGNVRIHGMSNNRIDTTTVTLTAETEWVFIYIARDGSSHSIDHQGTEPISDTNAVRVPLAKYVMNGVNNYSLVETCHKYDVQFANPLR